MDISPLPTFTSEAQQYQAAQLMQPTLIRVIDNLRKQLETVPWQSTYQERTLWPADATEADKERVMRLAAQLDGTDAAQAEAIHAELQQLPRPFPKYELQLTQGDRTAAVDVWQLCYSVCFQDYDPAQPAIVDATLFDETGEIDWLALDDKARQRVEAVFQEVAQTLGTDG